MDKYELFEKVVGIDIADVFENNNVRLSSCDVYENNGKTEYCAEFEFYSDLGEDFILSLDWFEDRESFCEALQKYCQDFDPEEHAAMWWENKDKVRGVPQSLIALVKDALSIETFLSELCCQVHEKKNLQP